ncbi:protein kinase family protein [Bacillus pinisoli]|uniref:protein kinase family protein n=1 Tax=Bacillus pinisoli TaxID=2901866 RepID=UPI001FF0E003|nr:protein kinase family protein [Bacillus pinisoli]
MKTFEELAAGTMFSVSKGVPTLHKYDTSLTLIGEGRSAVVFRINSTDLALKVFLPGQERTAIEEASIYRLLAGNSYFPTLHGSGENYIVIDYIEGITIFNCLQYGLRISEEHIKVIDEALEQARTCGLNPSDVHLKNILITNSGDIKLIDVARFLQTKNCSQWDDIKWAYHTFYRRNVFPKRIPALILNLISLVYKRPTIQKWLTNSQKYA